MYYEKYLNDLYTSSGWATDKAFAESPGCLRGAWGEPHAEGGVILSDHGGRLVVDGGDECRHVLVIGATGTGKSRLIILPSLIYSLTAREKRSFVVYDVKGELEAATEEIAESNGYTLRRVNFRNPEQGETWNPFVRMNRLFQRPRLRAKAWKLLEDLIASVFTDGGSTRSDPFWRNSSSTLFRGICGIIWEKGGALSLSEIMRLAGTIPYDKDLDASCELFEAAALSGPKSVAHRNLEGIRNASQITRGNILSSFNSYLSAITSRDDIMKMMSSATSISFRELGEKPTMLYISLPDDTLALGQLQSILLTQLTQELNECAMHNCGRLPVRTEIYLDEICNIHPAIPALETGLTISRSRGIRYILAIQSYSQLEGVYGRAADTIAANCSTWIALNIAKDETFRSKLSQLCGENPLGNPLITPSRLSLLDYEQGIVIRERTEPYFARFEDVGKVLERLRRIEEQRRQSAGRRPGVAAPAHGQRDLSA